MYCVSVIIPAHNEATLLNACLASVLGQEGDLSIDAVVVVNGSTDETVSVAHGWERRFADQQHVLNVIELDEANKVAALNEGDRWAKYEDRMYLDADITLSVSALLEVCQLFDDQAVGVCAPICRIEDAESWITSSYAKVWTMLPYFSEGVIGSGCYAVSGWGRRRWQSFPAIIADDKFVRLQFAASERAITPHAEFRVRLPQGLLEMVSVRTRWSAGNRELAFVYPDLDRADNRRHGASAVALVRRPKLWVHGVVFVFVYLLAELRAIRRWHRSAAIWERAESVRQPTTVVEVDVDVATHPSIAEVEGRTAQQPSNVA